MDQKNILTVLIHNLKIRLAYWNSNTILGSLNNLL